MFSKTCKILNETFKKYFNDFESRKPVFNSNKNVNDFLWTILAKVAKKFRFRNFAKFKISYFAKNEGNFAKHESEIWAKFCISRKTKSKFGQPFGHFNFNFWDTMFSKSKWILINFHLGQRKFGFLDFLKAQK